ncbi:MAG TPA: hypothetical protein VGG72_11825 [Bryobacteraceae bacterium]|jgi:hypothetical protein
MKTILKSLIIPASVALLMAASPSWKSKQMEQWSEQDAKLILTDSPWVRKVTPALMPPLNEDQRRQGGQMGGGEGIGMVAFSPATLTGVGATSTAGKRRPAKVATLEIRWESARAVRSAELKAHEEDAPVVAQGAYAIALYDVPGIDVNQTALPFQLKKDAFLKCEGKKDLRASRVDLLPQEGGLATIVFMFPRSQEFSIEDRRITFIAQLGRLSVAQYFYTAEMQIQGKLEL